MEAVVLTLMKVWLIVSVKKGLFEKRATILS